MNMKSAICADFTSDSAPILNAAPEAIKLDPKQTALIIVDMQNAYASSGGYLDLAGFDVSTTQPVIEQIKKAMDIIPRKAAIWIWRALMSQRPSQWLKILKRQLMQRMQLVFR